MLTDNRKINTTRGIRNNNPMNLVKGVDFQYQVANPKEDKFMTFGKTWQGIRAGVLDITSDISKGKNTLKILINEYAPKFENDTTGYINTLAKRLNIGANDILNRKDEKFMFNLVKSIIVVENGAGSLKFITDEDIKEGINSAFIYRGYKVTPKAKKADTGKENGLISVIVGVGVVLFLAKLLIK
jgi:hypothetical protein